MVPRRRRADAGRGSGTWAATATTRPRSTPPRSSASACRASASATARGAPSSATPPASRCRWPAARRGTPTSRSGSATPSAASCAPSAPNLTGAVCVNVLRHPAWGRAQETYGEDPHHVGELGAALTRGLQRHVMACVKHFACNSMENARFSRRHRGRRGRPARGVPPALPADRRRGRRRRSCRRTTASTASGAARTDELLTDILRDEWGFEGFVISDWIFGLRDAATSVDGRPRRRDAVPHGASPAPRATRSKRGDASWADVDRCVERIVATLLRFDDVLSQPEPVCRRARLARAPRARPRGRRPLGRPAPQRAGRRRAGAAPRARS